MASTCATSNYTSDDDEVVSRPYGNLYAGLLGLMGLLGVLLNSLVLVGVCGNARLGTTINKLLIWICGVAILESSAGILIKALILGELDKWVEDGNHG
jgi:hypothetical protein